MYVTYFGLYLVHPQARQYKQQEMVSLLTCLRMD